MEPTLDLGGYQFKNLLQRHGLSGVDITKPAKGIVNTVLLAGDKVLKINTRDPQSSKLDVEANIFEYFTLNQGLGVPVPSLIHNSSNGNEADFPYPYIIMSLLPGETLGEVLAHSELALQMDLIAQCGQQMGTIHNQNPNQLTLPGEFPEATISHSSEINEAISALRNTSDLGFSEAKLERLTRIFSSSGLSDYVCEPVLTHGNFGIDNILVEGGKISGIIDWEWAKFDNPEKELAIFLYRVLKTEEERMVFLNKYQETHTLDQGFNKRYLAYPLLYFISLLPKALTWKPEKRKEYFDQVDLLLALS